MGFRPGKLVGDDASVRYACYPFPTPLRFFNSFSMIGRYNRYVLQLPPLRTQLIGPWRAVQ